MSEDIHSCEQGAAEKFCFLLGKNAVETVLMLQTAYKGDNMGKIQACDWFSRLKKMVKLRSMTNLVLNVLQLPERTKISRKLVQLR